MIFHSRKLIWKQKCLGNVSLSQYVHIRHAKLSSLDCWNIIVQSTKASYNSLTPGKHGYNLKCVIAEQMSWINFISTSCEILHWWMTLTTFDDKCTLVQVTAWCHQATNHNLGQSWSKSMFPYGFIRPQWVKSLIAQQHFDKYIFIVVSTMLTEGDIKWAIKPW